MQKGTVIKSTGSWYLVLLDNQEVLECRIMGKFRLDGKRLTNPVAVGDYVMVTADPGQEAGKGVIKEILPRENYVVRQSPRKKHDLHLLASNIDQAILIVTIAQPMLKQGFIDRFLLMTEPYNIPTTIIFNKSDVYTDEDLLTYQALTEVYHPIGYDTLLVSALDGFNLLAFKKLLKDKISLVSGQSGVGKSSLINAVQPQLNLRTGDISDYSGKGQHTTTFAEMHPLDFGGHIIDTPGIKTLSFNHLEPIDIAHNFREFFALSDQCKFGGDCLHRAEPGCAVKVALQEDKISELRYFNYIALLEEAENQNYWERDKGM